MRWSILTIYPAVIAATAACGPLGRTESDPYPDTGNYPETGSVQVEQRALNSCRSLVADRWDVSESRVRTWIRGEMDPRTATTTVDWEVRDGPQGFCRVTAAGEVIEVERTGSDDDVGYNAPDDPFDRDDGDWGSREVRSSQLQVCREEVMRRYDERSTDVGLTAGTLDDRGVAYIQWNTRSGRSGTCLVDSSNVLLQFRSR